jgi:hypothetical protein
VRPRRLNLSHVFRSTRHGCASRRRSAAEEALRKMELLRIVNLIQRGDGELEWLWESWSKRERNLRMTLFFEALKEPARKEKTFGL